MSDETPSQPKRPELPDLSGLYGAMRIPQSSTFTMPKNALVRNAEANFASEFCRRILKWVEDFDRTLDEQHEVGIRLVNFGQTVSFHLQDIGYWDPSLLMFSGVTASGEPVELIQHVSQISVLLMKVPLLDPTVPKRRCWFHDVEQTG